MITILCLGDIVGEVGRSTVAYYLPILLDTYNPNIIIANGENASGGIGINAKNADELFSCGIDVITTGNHIWRHKDIQHYFGNTKRLIRPLNYGEEAPGKGWVLFEKNGLRYLVLNLLGSVYMDNLYPPFIYLKNFHKMNKEVFDEANVVILDFHAEATSEKIAMGYYANSYVNIIYGTHTHVQTADEKILDNKTAYITDIGMIGPLNSVIGMEIETILSKFDTLMPKQYRVAEGDAVFNGIIIQYNEKTEECNSIIRINEIIDKKKVKNNLR